MNNHKGLTIWTLVANFFIIIAAGHGIGTIGLLQLVTVADLLGFNDFFSSEERFQYLLFWAVVINFLGQLFVLASLLKKQRPVYTRVTGLGLLLTAFLVLIYYLREQDTLMATVITGIPFLILSAVLTYKHLHSIEVIVEV